MTTIAAPSRRTTDDDQPIGRRLAGAGAAAPGRAHCSGRCCRQRSVASRRSGWSARCSTRTPVNYLEWARLRSHKPTRIGSRRHWWTPSWGWGGCNAFSMTNPWRTLTATAATRFSSPTPTAGLTRASRWRTAMPSWWRWSARTRPRQAWSATVRARNVASTVACRGCRFVCRTDRDSSQSCQSAAVPWCRSGGIR